MRFIGLLIFIFSLICCKQKPKCANPINKSIVKKILLDFIQIDSLNELEQAAIVDFSYKKPEYADGLLTPSPPGSSNINELDVIFYVDNESYFNHQDTSTIKVQIKNSSHRIPAMFKDTNTFDPDLPIYTFYIPILNCNRSAAFVSYTYNRGNYWEYKGALLEQSGSKWNIVKKVSISMK